MLKSQMLDLDHQVRDINQLRLMEVQLLHLTTIKLALCNMMQALQEEIKVDQDLHQEDMLEMVHHLDHHISHPINIEQSFLENT